MRTFALTLPAWARPREFLGVGAPLADTLVRPLFANVVKQQNPAAAQEEIDAETTAALALWRTAMPNATAIPSDTDITPFVQSAIAMWASGTLPGSPTRANVLARTIDLAGSVLDPKKFNLSLQALWVIGTAAGDGWFAAHPFTYPTNVTIWPWLSSAHAWWMNIGQNLPIALAQTVTWDNVVKNTAPIQPSGLGSSTPTQPSWLGSFPSSWLGSFPSTQPRPPPPPPGTFPAGSPRAVTPVPGVFVDLDGTTVAIPAGTNLAAPWLDPVHSIMRSAFVGGAPGAFAALFAFALGTNAFALGQPVTVSPSGTIVLPALVFTPIKKDPVRAAAPTLVTAITAAPGSFDSVGTANGQATSTTIGIPAGQNLGGMWQDGNGNPRPPFVGPGPAAGTFVALSPFRLGGSSFAQGDAVPVSPSGQIVSAAKTGSATFQAPPITTIAGSDGTFGSLVIPEGQNLGAPWTAGDGSTQDPLIVAQPLGQAGVAGKVVQPFHLGPVGFAGGDFAPGDFVFTEFNTIVARSATPVPLPTGQVIGPSLTAITQKPGTFNGLTIHAGTDIAATPWTTADGTLESPLVMSLQNLGGPLLVVVLQPFVLGTPSTGQTSFGIGDKASSQADSLVLSLTTSPVITAITQGPGSSGQVLIPQGRDIASPWVDPNGVTQPPLVASVMSTDPSGVLQAVPLQDFQINEVNPGSTSSVAQLFTHGQVFNSDPASVVLTQIGGPPATLGGCAITAAPGQVGAVGIPVGSNLARGWTGADGSPQPPIVSMVPAAFTGPGGSGFQELTATALQPFTLGTLSVPLGGSFTPAGHGIQGSVLAATPSAALQDAPLVLACPPPTGGGSGGGGNTAGGGGTWGSAGGAGSGSPAASGWSTWTTGEQIACVLGVAGTAAVGLYAITHAGGAAAAGAAHPAPNPARVPQEQRSLFQEELILTPSPGEGPARGIRAPERAGQMTLVEYEVEQRKGPPVKGFGPGGPYRKNPAGTTIKYDLYTLGFPTPEQAREFYRADPIGHVQQRWIEGTVVILGFFSSERCFHGESLDQKYTRIKAIGKRYGAERLSQSFNQAVPA